MQYTIRKIMLATCLALASVAVETNTISIKDQGDSSPTIAVPAPAPSPVPTTESSNKELYNDLHLASNGMDPEVFELALKGFTKLADEGKIANRDKITIIDFSQPSNQKRL